MYLYFIIFKILWTWEYSNKWQKSCRIINAFMVELIVHSLDSFLNSILKMNIFLPLGSHKDFFGGFVTEISSTDWSSTWNEWSSSWISGVWWLINCSGGGERSWISCRSGKASLGKIHSDSWGTWLKRR